MDWVQQFLADFFLLSPFPGTEIHGQYDRRLVLLSVMIGSAGAYVGFSLIDYLHRRESTAGRIGYMSLAGLTMGASIWSLHFLGMLAFKLPVLVSYDLAITLLSILPAFAASTAAVYFLSRRDAGRRRIFVCGVLMAVAIATMHYTGMAAMRIDGRMAYDPAIFALSLLVGLTLSPLALKLRSLFRIFLPSLAATLAGAVAFGVVIATVHYTAMAATRFYTDVTVLSGSAPVSSNPALAGIVSAAAIVILLAAVLITTFEQKLFTARRALQKTESRMQAVIESIGEAIFVFTKDGSILSANPAARHIFGVGKEEAFAPLPSLIVDEDGQDILKVATTMKPGSRGASGRPEVMGEVEGRRADGTSFPMDLTITRLQNERGRLVAICRDITDRKLAAEKMEAQKDRLEVLLAERAEKLENTVRQLETEVEIRRKAEQMANAAREEAEIANRSKSEFLANVSHELRTPLNAIIGFSEVLMDERLSRLAGQQNYLEDIHSSGRHLLSIINDILDIAKVEADRMMLEETTFPVEQLVESATRIVGERITNAGLTLEVAGPDEKVSLRADERKLKQLLLNLLSNSIKFTKPGGTIVVAADIMEDGFALSVHDTGIGMSETDLEKVMDPFVQVDSSRTRVHEGTGLGLSIARSFAELHDGHLTIESKEGEGTCVTLVLPEERVFIAEGSITGKGQAVQ